MNSVDQGGCLLTLAFPTESSMTQFYKLALKASLIAAPPAALTHPELLSLMFRNNADVRDRVLHFGIPDTMRAAFWSILSGAEVTHHLNHQPASFNLCECPPRAAVTNLASPHIIQFICERHPGLFDQLCARESQVQFPRSRRPAVVVTCAAVAEPP